MAKASSCAEKFSQFQKLISTKFSIHLPPESKNVDLFHVFYQDTCTS